jgi:hypothetical protein
LARKSRTDQGERRLASTTLTKAIEGLALEQPPLPISSIYRQASLVAETLKERKPSYAVVRRIVRNLPASLLTLAHRGNKAYSEGFDLVHRREASKPHVTMAGCAIHSINMNADIGTPVRCLPTRFCKRSPERAMTRFQRRFI